MKAAITKRRILSACFIWPLAQAFDLRYYNVALSGLDVFGSTTMLKA